MKFHTPIRMLIGTEIGSLGRNFYFQFYQIFVITYAKIGCWISNPEVPCSKPLGGSKVDSAVHPSEVDKMSTKDFWKLSGKK